MNFWNTDRVRTALDGAVDGEASRDALELTGVTTDSRAVQRGQLFVALIGEKFDAHDFLADAMKAFQQRKMSQRKTVHDEMQKLQQLVDSKASDAQLKQQLAVVASVKDARVERDAFLADTSKFLTVQEQAKLEVALPQVMREAHKAKREFRHERKGENGGFNR